MGKSGEGKCIENKPKENGGNETEANIKGDDDLDESFSQVGDGEDDDEAMDEDVQDDEEKDADTPAAGATGLSTPAVETPLETPYSEVPASNLSVPIESSSLSHPPINAKTPSAPTSIAATPAPEAAVDPIPSNAIELTNVAPGHTEEGTGDLGEEAGMEVHVHESEAVSAADEDVVMGESEGQEAKKDEEKVPVNDDEGLVHGEMEPPVPALAVTEGDHPPPEVEKEE